MTRRRRPRHRPVWPLRRGARRYRQLHRLSQWLPEPQAHRRARYAGAGAVVRLCRAARQRPASDHRRRGLLRLRLRQHRTGRALARSASALHSADDQGTILSIAASIGVPAGRWQGTPFNLSQDLASQLAAAPDPERALGILGSEVYDSLRPTLKALAFRAYGQRRAYFPDSTESGFDKANVRDGHYHLWSYTHWLQRLDPGGQPKKPLAARVIDLLVGKTVCPARLRAALQHQPRRPGAALCHARRAQSGGRRLFAVRPRPALWLLLGQHHRHQPLCKLQRHPALRIGRLPPRLLRGALAHAHPRCAASPIAASPRPRSARHQPASFGGLPRRAAAVPADLGSPASDDMSCYTQPTTHLEILNACTSAQSVSKQPVLPLLRADGTLPPLP